MKRLILFASVLSVLLGILAAQCLSLEWGTSVLFALGDVSAILFGVFGLWLGICYKPGMEDDLVGKKDKELTDAKAILLNARRFHIVFRGVVISSIIFVLSMTARAFIPMVKIIPFLKEHPIYFKAVFFACVIFCVISQCYSVLMSIAPMLEAKKNMNRAKCDAEDILSL